MNRLTQIGLNCGTDKAYWHKYTGFYETYIGGFINPNILEIGVDLGASLKMWEEYFGAPYIVGVDIIDKKAYETKSTKTLIADQGKPNELLKCLDICKEYDIMVDDGSHIIGHQISSFVTLFPYLKSGGVYFLEDLHTSFWTDTVGKTYANPNNDAVTAYDFLYNISKNIEFYTPHASSEQIQYVKDNMVRIDFFTRVENNFSDSVTSAIVKK
jgi:hypothetical protein